MKVKRKELLDTLTKVQPGLASKEMIEQSKSFIFKDNKIITYNDEISISCKFKCDFEGAIKSEEFYKLLGKSKVKEMEITVEEGELRLKTKSSTAGIKMEDKINLPIDEVDRSGKKKELPEKFLEGLKFCLFSVSKDAAKELLTCLLVKKNYVLSCDNYRLTKYKFGREVDVKKSFVLPSQAAKQLLSYKPTHYAIS